MAEPAGGNDPAARLEALRLLIRRGDDSAIAGMLDLLRQSQNDAAAAEASHALVALYRHLADFNSREAVMAADGLLKLASEAEQEFQRGLALNGYIRLIGVRRDLAPAGLYDMAETALGLAERDVETRMIIRRLGRIPDLRVLALLEQCAGEHEILGETDMALAAKTAYVDAAALISKTHPAEAKAALLKAADTLIVDGDLRERALEAARAIK